MLAARMHGYRQPLVLEEVNIPEISSDQVLVRVGGAGMCRSDVQLIDGYFQEAIKPKFPITPGHEIAGLVEALGDRVPETAQLAVDDQVVVSAGWGDGTCRQCRPVMSRSVSTEVGRDLVPPVVTPSSLPCRIDSSSVLSTG
jgi:propanol-preferring alcohol dehydrogenase